MAIERVTARVLPVSPDGAVLLLQDQDPAVPGVMRWGSIGGGVDPGETLTQAAVREMGEETGIVIEVERLSAPVHRDTHPFSYDGVDYVGVSTFFAIAMPRDVEVSFDQLEPDEVGNVVASAWWTPDDLDRDGTAVAPELTIAMRAAVVAMGVAT